MERLESTVKPHISLSSIAILLGAFTLLSRIVGLIRDLILASLYGAGPTLDAYYTAFRIPDLLFNIFILGTLSVAFLPLFTRELVKDKVEAGQFASVIYTVSLSIVLGLSLLLTIFAPVLVSLIAPGFSGEQRELTILLTRFMLFAPLFFTISSITSVILQSHNIFLPTAAAPLFYNGGIIFGAAVLTRFLGPVGLGIGVIIGASLHAAIQLFPLRKLKLPLRVSFNTKLKVVRELWRMYVPRLLSLDNGQISLLVGSIIGSWLAAGSITIFNFANNLQAVPLGIFALSFAVASFPLLSRTWAAQQSEEFKRVISRTALQILFFIIPLSVIMIILRAQIVRLLLGRGQFGWDDTRLTAQALGILALSLFAQSLIPLLARAFYATYNTRIPVITGLIAAAINIVCAVVFSRTLGVLGVALGATIASVVNVMMLVITLRIHIGKLHDLSFSENLLKIIIASIFSAISAYAMLYAVAPAVDMTKTMGVLIQAGSAGVVAASVYLTVALLLDLDEAKKFLRKIKPLLNKFI